MKIHIILKLMVLIFYFVSTDLLYSQPGICPPETSSWNTSRADCIQRIYTFNDNLGSVDYKWQINGSNIDIFVDWNSLINSSGVINLSNEDLQSLLILKIIKDRCQCPFEGTKTISFTEVVQCTVERNCYFRVSND